MTDHRFPEDAGTGAYSSGSGDKNDGASLAQVYDAIGRTDYAKGLSFDVDYTVPEVTISMEKAVVSDDSATATQTGESRSGVAYVQEMDPRTRSLSDGTTNYVYLDLDLSTEDGASYHIDTDQTPPSAPYLYLGWVDTSSDSYSLANDRPDGEFSTLSTGQLSGKYPEKVRAVANGEVVASIDPSNTSRPVQGAIDAVDAATGSTSRLNGWGAVLLPPDKVQESGTLTSLGGKRLLGHGIESSVIEFTDLDAPGWEITSFADSERSYADGVTFDGSDRANRTAPLIHYSGTVTPYSAHIGRIKFKNAQYPVVHFENGHPFSSHWEFVRGTDYDGGLLLAGNLSKMFSIGEIYGTPVNPPANNDVGVVNLANTTGTVVNIRQINAGGANVRALDANLKANGNLEVGNINFEPSTGGSHGSAVRLLNGGGTQIGGIAVANVTDIDQFVEMRNAQNKHIGQCVKPSGVTINNARVATFTDTVGENTYVGSSSEVSNNSGAALTYPIACLGDLTTVS